MSIEDPDLVRLLLEYGMDTGGIPFLVACMLRSLEIAQQLLSFGASMNTAKADGTTPLIVASKWGRVDVIRFVLDNKHQMKESCRSTLQLKKDRCAKELSRCHRAQTARPRRRSQQRD